jgi:predicted small secreted protein
MNPRFLAIVATVAFLAGCNTMHGVGEDIDAGGRKVEGVLKKDKPAGDSNAGTTSTPAPATSGSNGDSTGRAADTSMSTPPSGTKTQ